MDYSFPILLLTVAAPFLPFRFSLPLALAHTFLCIILASLLSHCPWCSTVDVDRGRLLNFSPDSVGPTQPAVAIADGQSG